MKCYQMVLLAAADLDEVFSFEQLAVACWEKWPKVFGLKGYTDRHPDAHRVLLELVGVKGLVSREFFLKHAAKTYSISRWGKIEIRRMQDAAVGVG